MFTRKMFTDPRLITLKMINQQIRPMLWNLTVLIDQHSKITAVIFIQNLAPGWGVISPQPAPAPSLVSNGLKLETLSSLYLTGTKKGFSMIV